MNKILKGTLYLIAVLLMFSSCQKKAQDEYYNRPGWLAEPIYQQLEKKGNFRSLLTLINKAKYNTVLDRAGYWTLFAPNDKAFEAYFSSNGISGAEAIDSAAAYKMVSYLLVYNAFETSRISDYQANTGWVPNNAFRRRTAFYSGVYNDTVNGKVIKVLASNRNNTNGSNYYISSDNNNKYITYFTDNYFTAKELSASDYSYFFPDASYSGFNVMGAKVVNPNIIAENGVIHEVDKVITPAQNIDQYLVGKPQYSEFKKILDKYLVSFVVNEAATKQYQIQTGSSDKVYIKVYNPGLAFSPNNENYLKLADNDGQSDGWTMFIPTNEVLLTYINTVLLEFYPSLDVIPTQVLVDFVNAHMWSKVVWPSRFNKTYNTHGEEARFNSASDVTDKNVLSNGFFYGVNKVQRSNLFSTVYGRVYLNPAYSLMTRALDADLKYIITNPSLRFTMFIASDAVIRSAGFDFDIIRNEWTYAINGTITERGTAARNRLMRILNAHVVLTPKNELDNLSGTGIAEGYGGEFIRFNSNKLYAAGNEDASTTVNVIGTGINTSNGKVYVVDRLLNYSDLNIGKHIEKYNALPGSTITLFTKYLQASSIYLPATGEIVGTLPGVFYTLFIPDDAAVQAAVNAGLLPGTGTGAVKTPNTTASTYGIKEKEQVAKFIQYHILNKKTIASTGTGEETVETLFRKSSGDPTTIKVNALTGSIQVTDMLLNVASANMAKSNLLSNRCVIHQINKVLRYTE